MEVKVERAVKSYELLFSLPSQEKLALTIAILGAVLGLATPQPTLGLILFSLPAYLSALLSVKINPGKVLTIKRSLGISAIALTLQGTLYLSVWLVAKSLTPDLEAYAIIVSGALFTSLSTSVLFWLTGSYMKATAPPVTAQSLTTILASHIFIFDPLIAIRLFLTVQVAALIITYSGALLINRAGLKAAGRKVFGLFKSFAYTWLADEPDMLENELLQVSSEEEVSVTTLLFKSQKGLEGVFITYTAHPGPFRNLGGSNLPSRLVQTLEGNLGGLALPFHSTATHRLDPASRLEAEKVVEAALRAAQKAVKLEEPYVSPYVCAEEQNLQVCCQLLGIPVFTVTWTSQGAEDLPVEVGEKLRQKSREKGFKDALVIEAHNMYLPEAQPTIHLEALTQAAYKSLSLAEKKAFKTRLKAAFASIKDPEFSKERGFGEAGIRLAVIEVSGRKHLYVLIDGNNLQPSLRWKLKDELLNTGFDTCEVYTTDTHSVVALKPMKRGYRAIGEEVDHNTLVSRIRDVAKSLRENLVEVEVEVGEAKVKIKTIGEKGLSQLLQALEECLRLAKITLPATYALTAVLSSILVFFL